jgi:hypothetical protein
MEHTTRRAALGRLGGLLGWLTLFLLPGRRALAAARQGVQRGGSAHGSQGAIPTAKPPLHAVKRHA